jgi:hypothetical protein
MCFIIDTPNVGIEFGNLGGEVDSEIVDLATQILARLRCQVQHPTGAHDAGLDLDLAPPWREQRHPSKCAAFISFTAAATTTTAGLTRARMGRCAHLKANHLDVTIRQRQPEHLVWQWRW